MFTNHSTNHESQNFIKNIILEFCHKNTNNLHSEVLLNFLKEDLDQPNLLYKICYYLNQHEDDFTWHRESEFLCHLKQLHSNLQGGLHDHVNNELYYFLLKR